MKEKVFFYGSFRKGLHKYDTYLFDEDTFISYAYIEGALYTAILQKYPILVRECHELVLGEIHDICQETLKVIENDLNCYGNFNEYYKDKCSVYDENHNLIENVTIYMVNMDNPRNRIFIDEYIRSGDYVHYILNKQPLKKSVFNFDK